MMKRLAMSIIVVAVVYVSFVSAGQLRPEEKRALEVKPAVALVVVQFQTKWTLGDISVKLPHGEIGTGFFFRPDGYLITNGHVVQHANLKDLQAVQSLQNELRKDAIRNLTGLIALIEKQTGKKLTDRDVVTLAQKATIELVGPPTLTLVLANGKTINADILQYSAPVTENGKDVAVLKVGGSNYPTVPLGNSEQVRLQDPVMVVGYPGVASPWGGNPLISAESNFESSATDGHISAVKTSAIGVPVLQSDVAITHGNSGGPAFNDQGQVIGIATFGSLDQSGQAVQGFNFLVPINTAMEFVHQTGVQAERGTFNQHWDQALDYYDAGQFHKAIAEFDNVLQFMPDLPDAKKYRAAAVVAEDKLNPLQKLVETTGTTPLYILVLVLVLAAVALVMRRKPAPQPAMATAAAAGGARLAATRPVLQTGPGVSVLPPAAEANYGSIQFISGPLSGRSFKISKDGLWIGRDPRCGAVLPDDTVSGEHAWIVPVEGSVVVIDKGSSNGTYVNSVDSPRVSKISLKNGDRIFIGKKGPVATYFAA
ncbi:MAG TPA: trypsin-like peptidase domain-containing protein [Candidatus Bathyarchaeia archaeon]|nr:trypsin-like peptidase domain-containing protein [Candidatus Bathyarchaeia archaeon]